MAERRKIVLAYSGGLDTSVAIHWLRERYDADVATLTIDLGANAELDEARERVAQVFADTYGHRSADRRVQRWRLFFMALAETFAYRDGHEWGVSHHRLGKHSR